MDLHRDAFASNDATYLNSDDGNVAAAAVGTFALGTHCASAAVAVDRFRASWTGIDIAGLDVACASGAPAEGIS